MTRPVYLVAVLLLAGCGSGTGSKAGFSCDDLLRTQVRTYAATGTLKGPNLPDQQAKYWKLVTQDFTRYGFDDAANAAAELHAFAVVGTGTAKSRADNLAAVAVGLDAAGEVCDP